MAGVSGFGSDAGAHSELPPQARVPGLPRIPRRLVPRPRLAHRLDRLAPLTLVEGLPGQGRTTLVADWVRDRVRDGDTAVWVHARPDHNTPGRLLDDLAALITAAPASSQSTAHGSEPTTRLHEALAGSNPPTAIIVIDRADELIEEQAVNDLITLLLEYDFLHVVAIGRQNDLVHAAASDRGLEMHPINGADLVLSLEELPQFADAWGHRITPTRAAELHQSVGGWLKPLRLVLDANPAMTLVASSRPVRTYIEDHLLPALSPRCAEIASMLALTDIVSREAALALIALTSEAEVDALTADQALDELHRHGLLQPLPGAEDRWRLPTTLRRVLAERVQRDHPEITARCHRALAQAHQDIAGTPALGQSMVHARLGQDWALLDRLWREHNMLMAAAAPVDFVTSYADLPNDVLADRPSLRVPHRLARAVATASDDAAKPTTIRRHYLRLGAIGLRSLHEISDPTERHAMVLAAAAHQRAVGRTEQAERLLNLAEEQASEWLIGDSQEAAYASQIWFSFQRGLTALLRGDFATSLENLSTVHQMRPKGALAVPAASHLALGYAVSAAPAEARRWLQRARSTAAASPALASLTELPSGITRAMLAMDQLDVTGTEQALAGVGDGTEARDLWLAIVVARARHAVYFGNPIEMVAALDRISTAHAEVLQNSAVARDIMARCRADLLMRLGELNRALASLDAEPQHPPSVQPPFGSPPLDQW